MRQSVQSQIYEVQSEFVDAPGTQLRVALGDARHPDQLQAALGVAGWSLGTATRARMDRIQSEAITDPVGPEFMAPLQRA